MRMLTLENKCFALNDLPDELGEDEDVRLVY